MMMFHIKKADARDRIPGEELTKSVGTGMDEDILIDCCLIEVDDLKEGESVLKAFESIDRDVEGDELKKGGSEVVGLWGVISGSRESNWLEIWQFVPGDNTNNP